MKQARISKQKTNFLHANNKSGRITAWSNNDHHSTQNCYTTEHDTHIFANFGFVGSGERAYIGLIMDNYSSIINTVILFISWYNPYILASTKFKV